MASTDKKTLHIAVAGNIGSGKTTLTSLLAKNLKWEPHFEDVDDNPYLNDFYEDMQRWSFNLQIYFLNSRFDQIMKIRKSGNSGITYHIDSCASTMPTIEVTPESMTTPAAARTSGSS